MDNFHNLRNKIITSEFGATKRLLNLNRLILFSTMTSLHAQHHFLFRSYLTILLLTVQVSQSYSYDLDYLESGFELEYDETTKADDLIGTYVTNYAVFIVGLISAVIIWLTTQHKGGIMTCYFLFVGLGYGFAGVGHQFFSNDIGKISYTLGLIVVHIGNTFLALLAIRFFTSSLYATVGCAAINLIIIIFIGIKGFEPALITGAAIDVGATVVFLVQARVQIGFRFAFVAKALGIVIQLAGGMVQFLLSSKCGPKAYEDCFEECPLHYNFNHNALFHVIFLVALLVLLVSEIIVPSHYFLKSAEHKDTNFKSTTDEEDYAKTMMSNALSIEFV